MPQLVREWRYFSQMEEGVEIGESMSLHSWRQQTQNRHAVIDCSLGRKPRLLVSRLLGNKGRDSYQWPPATLW
jgi:hypothetical protein